MELIGRDSELAALHQRLRERRLVTLIGPGGIGKTTLARAAAAAVADDYELGVKAVDLARTSAAADVPDAIAAELGHPSFETLLDTPTDKPALVLLDNCEHVVAAVADAVDRLLEACHAPTVLATSRSPLDLPEEAVVILGPLGLPPPGVTDPDAEAVRLFCDRARDAGAPPSPEDLEAICELCRRLDGVPLGIELAGARTRILTPAQMLDHFDRQLDVVARTGRRGPARHRSLRDTIAWSHALLDDADRPFFERLSVFTGPFTLEHSHAVASDPGDDLATTLDHLDRLVATSLLGTETDATTTWYRLLESVRTYAAERLGERGEHDATMDRFVAHAVEAARGAVEHYDQPWDAEVVGGLVGFLDNLLAAARWCVVHDDEPNRTLLLVAAMWAAVHHARTAEIADVGEQVLRRWPDPSLPLWPDAAATVATAQHLLGRRDTAVDLATRALDAPGESVLAPVTLRRVLALTARADGDPQAALELLRDAAAHARALGAHTIAVELDAFAAEAVADLGDPDAALDQLQACAQAAAEQGSTMLAAWARTVEAHLLLRTDPSAATDIIEAALHETRHLDYHAGVAAGLSAKACERLLHHDLPGAAAVTLELLDELAITGAVGLTRTGLELAATILNRFDRPAWADVAATAATLPSRGGLPGELPPELRPPPADGAPLRVRDAFTLARRELNAERAGPTAAPATAEPARPTFRRTGDLWEIEYAGRSVHLRHSKGMDDLAQLLARPGRELHCLDLAGVAAIQADTGETLDHTARAAYEERILDLQAELEDAENDNDLARAERARTELDQLVEQLTSALGLGNRTRLTGATTERTRTAVTHRIRSAIRRIGQAHQRLGRHLDASIHTGTYCTYQPEEPIHWCTS